VNHHKIEENIPKDNEQCKLLFSNSEIFNDLSEIEQFNEDKPMINKSIDQMFRDFSASNYTTWKENFDSGDP
jgi:hypothetical protein